MVRRRRGGLPGDRALEKDGRPCGLACCCGDLGAFAPLMGLPTGQERATVQESWRSFCLKHYLGTFRSEMSTVAGRVKGQINGWDGEYSRNERILKKGKEDGQTEGREEGVRMKREAGGGGGSSL